jgi:hypothetical protein
MAYARTGLHRTALAFVVALGFMTAGCPGPEPIGDDGGTADVGSTDGGRADSGRADSGRPVDGGRDTGPLVDSGALDTGTVDAGTPEDAATDDAATDDAGIDAALLADSGPPDGGVVFDLTGTYTDCWNWVGGATGSGTTHLVQVGSHVTGSSMGPDGGYDFVGDMFGYVLVGTWATTADPTYMGAISFTFDPAAMGWTGTWTGPDGGGTWNGVRMGSGLTCVP